MNNNITKDIDYMLIYFAMQGKVWTVRNLIKKGANIDAQDLEGITALMEACENNYFRTVKLLIECGADVNIQDENGNTALHLAAKKGYEEIVNLLLNSDVNIGLTNNKGQTAKDLAYENGYYNIAMIISIFLFAGLSDVYSEIGEKQNYYTKK